MLLLLVAFSISCGTAAEYSPFRLLLNSSVDVIDQECLKGVQPCTTHLNIYANDSKVRTIAYDAFSKFSNLTSLSFNCPLRLTNRISWSDLKKLTELSFLHCGIISLPIGSFFESLDELLVLNLSSNSLKYLPTDFLSSARNVRVLDLSFNLLNQFPFLSSRNNINDIRIRGNPIICDGYNVWLYSQLPYSDINFVSSCKRDPIPYPRIFFADAQNQSFTTETTKRFSFMCNANSNVSVKIGVDSPIGFIPGPGWSDDLLATTTANYSYTVWPIVAETRIFLVQLNASTVSLTVDYVRGHHAGSWVCAVRFNSNVFKSEGVYTINPVTDIHEIFLSSTSVGFIFMGCFLALSIIIGSIRYLKETKCLTRPQLHKYVGHTLIGVIPVPGPERKFSIAFDDIELNHRICPPCLLQPCFFCGHCQRIHTFTDIEIKPAMNPSEGTLTFSNGFEEYSSTRIIGRSYRGNSGPVIDPLIESPARICKRRCKKSGPPQRESSSKSSSEIGLNECSEKFQQGLNIEQCDRVGIVTEAEVNCSYEFPTEYCHCRHQSHNFTSLEDENAEQSMLDVKLIVPDQNLAREYTEALQQLQDAADANDAVTFRERLEEFRAKLGRDIGTGVRVARDEFGVLRSKSAKSVAYIRDQSTAAAQRVKAGLTTVRDGMRSVAELCRVGGSIGQSISVISIVKDEATQISKEQCLSEFHF